MVAHKCGPGYAQLWTWFRTTVDLAMHEPALQVQSQRPVFGFYLHDRNMGYVLYECFVGIAHYLCDTASHTSMLYHRALIPCKQLMWTKERLRKDALQMTGMCDAYRSCVSG